MSVMTLEKKAMLEKVCTHQLEGLMFHFDYACMAKLLGHDKMACIQHKQAMKETQNHFDTVLRLVELYGEAIHASNGKPSTYAVEVGEKPPNKELADKICREMLKKWKDWECQTVQLYDEAIHVMPACKMWKRLKHDAEKELEYVSYLLHNKKYKGDVIL